jgi:hypothetical protein
MPPKTPSDRVHALRSALDAMMKDPEFIAEANKSMLELDGLNGVGLAKIINDTIEVPPELASGANFYISKRRGRSVAIGPKRASRVYSLHGRFDVRRKPSVT